MKTKVSIVKCDDYDLEKVYNAVKKSLEDINFHFKPKSKVLIKPNVLSQHTPEEAITTHPSVIDALCKILKENDCDITIGESSGFYMEGGTKKGLEICGIDAVAKKYNVKIFPFEDTVIKKIQDPKAKILKELNFSELIFDADLIISVPKMKTHELMVFTGAVKNLLGCLPGGIKQQCHVIAKNNDDFGDLLLDIYQNIVPGLSIMDGIIGLEGDGPGSAGTVKKTGLILASKNAIALDIVAEKTVDIDPNIVPTTKNAITRRLFPSFDDVEIIGEPIKIPYKKPKSIGRKIPKFITDFIMKEVMVNPIIDPKICKRCMKCVKICPAKTIKVKDNVVYVDKTNCIHCYCCHEMCPYSAIGLKSSRLIEFVKKLRDFLVKPKKK